jgi:hypothetical protein
MKKCKDRNFHRKDAKDAKEDQNLLRVLSAFAVESAFFFHNS